MSNEKNKKISILIPTNGKRIKDTNKALASVAKQVNNNDVELIIVSEGKSILKTLNTSGIDSVTEVVVPAKNGIFLNFVRGAEQAQGEYLMLMDDDIVYVENDLLKTLHNFLEENKNVWAVGPFINENKGLSYSKENRKYEAFKRRFKIWDPDDYTNKVYSCYGKGSANHPDNLPKEVHVGCHWLTNQALMIRKEVFLNHSTDDLDDFSKYWPIQRIWAVDFFTTYRLFLKKKDALAFMPNRSVIHLGAGATSFDISDRIKRETICGYYYFKRYMRDQNFFQYFVRPCVGRFFYIIKSSKGIKNLAKNLVAYFSSFYILFGVRNRIKSKPEYISEKVVLNLEEPVRVLYS